MKYFLKIYHKSRKHPAIYSLQSTNLWSFCVIFLLLSCMLYFIFDPLQSWAIWDLRAERARWVAFRFGGQQRKLRKTFLKLINVVKFPALRRLMFMDLRKEPSDYLFLMKIDNCLSGKMTQRFPTHHRPKELQPEKAFQNLSKIKSFLFRLQSRRLEREWNLEGKENESWMVRWAIKNIKKNSKSAADQERATTTRRILKR